VVLFTFSADSQVEAVIHFDDDTEELQQWDQQVSSAFHFYDVCVMGRASQHTRVAALNQRWQWVQYPWVLLTYTHPRHGKHILILSYG
jgi:hypothetical protein